MIVDNPWKKDEWSRYRRDWDTWKVANDMVKKSLDEAFSVYNHIGSGTTRSVFVQTESGDKSWDNVIKFPKCPYGILHNFSEHERSASGFDDFPIAHSAIDMALSIKFGVPVLKMERVQADKNIDSVILSKFDDVDNCQVGKNRKGTVVAFDYADNCQHWVFD